MFVSNKIIFVTFIDGFFFQIVLALQFFRLSLNPCRATSFVNQTILRFNTFRACLNLLIKRDEVANGLGSLIPHLLIISASQQHVSWRHSMAKCLLLAAVY